MTKFYQNIEAYLRGELSPEEKHAFEDALTHDENLAKDFSIYKQARLAVSGTLSNQGDEQKLRTTLKGLNSKYFSEDQNKEHIENKTQAKLVPIRKNWFRVAAIAASVLLILLAANWFFSAEKLSGPQLAEQFYTPKKTPATLGEPSADLLKNAYEQYKAKNFPEAIREFAAVQENYDRHTEAQLFLAYCHYENGQYDESIPYFEKVIAARDTRFSENAEWHKVLALLAAGKHRATIIQELKRIAGDEQHGYMEDAKILLDKI